MVISVHCIARRHRQSVFVCLTPIYLPSEYADFKTPLLGKVIEVKPNIYSQPASPCLLQLRMSSLSRAFYGPKPQNDRLAPDATESSRLPRRSHSSMVGVLS